MRRIYEYEDLQPVLDRLLEDKETNDMEFKTAKGGFPHSMWETYSSFANTDGGAIIFGIKEKDGRFYLDGLTKGQVEQYEKDFFNGIHNKQIVNIPLLNENDVQAVEFNGSHFLFFFIPRVDRSLRPVYCGLDPYTGTYRRDLDGDYHCSREEVNSMFADANLANPVDGRIIKNFSKKDLDPDSIKQYRRKFEQWNPDHVWNSLPEDTFLEKLNVLRKDRKTGESGLTYAGLLMFGTYSAIMDENPNFFPDYQEIEDPKDRWINRICPDGNWESNLFQFYSRVLPILQNFLPTLQKMFGNKLDTLDHNQLMALALAYSEEEISNERLQYALEMHKADISKMLGKLCKLQLLESSGYGRGTKYHVYGVDVSKKGKVATSDRKVATSSQKVATSKAKYSRDELIKLIVNYCSEWRTLEEIAFFIGRDKNYIRNKVLPQMTNILEKMYENIPNHPRQKYRARRKEADA